MTDPITYRHGDHWSTDAECPESGCEGYLRPVSGSVRVEVDGEYVRVGEWVFYPPEDTIAEAGKAIAAWTAYRDWLRARTLDHEHVMKTAQKVIQRNKELLERLSD